MLTTNFGTAAHTLEMLETKLTAAGLHESATRLRGITVEDRQTARLARDVLLLWPAPTELTLREWWDLAVQNLERVLRPEQAAA